MSDTCVTLSCSLHIYTFYRFFFSLVLLHSLCFDVPCRIRWVRSLDRKKIKRKCYFVHWLRLWSTTICDDSKHTTIIFSQWAIYSPNPIYPTGRMPIKYLSRSMQANWSQIYSVWFVIQRHTAVQTISNLSAEIEFLGLKQQKYNRNNRSSKSINLLFIDVKLWFHFVQRFVVLHFILNVTIR